MPPALSVHRQRVDRVEQRPVGAHEAGVPAESTPEHAWKRLERAGNSEAPIGGVSPSVAHQSRFILRDEVRQQIGHSALLEGNKSGFGSSRSRVSHKANQNKAALLQETTIKFELLPSGGLTDSSHHRPS